jgi:hypothetical protein
MAFTSTITQRPTAIGNKRMSAGTFANDGGSTGGDIDTGLSRCEAIWLQHTGAAVSADAPAVNETLPYSGSAITVVTTADTTGNWMAIGY